MSYHDRRSFLAVPAVVSILLAGNPGIAATWFVSPSGNDNSAGTIAMPLASIQKGHDLANAGDTVFIRGGTYQPSKPAVDLGGVAISKSGKPGKPICFFAYGSERPVFDFSKLSINTSGGYTHGFYVTGSHLRFRGFEIRNVPMNTRSNTGMTVRNASRDTFELMDFHHNHGAGLFFSAGSGGHLVRNCDAHDNYDPTSHQGDGQNADGFGVHYQTSGDTTKFEGCRAWWNSDDGWDFISQEYPVLLEKSWAYGNGYANSGTKHPGDGNGNGFKAGSSKNGVRHTIRNCVAWKNYAAGFYANHSSGGNTWINNTAWQNGSAFNLLASTWDANDNRTDGVILTGSRVHILRNNVAYPNKNLYMTGADSKGNSWDLGISPGAGDFSSTDDAGFMGPRGMDGSLPEISFLKLRGGSALIDKGVKVGLPYLGVAPDLGAYEYLAASSVSSPLARSVVPLGSEGFDLAGRLTNSRWSRLKLTRPKDSVGAHHQRFEAVIR